MFFIFEFVYQTSKIANYIFDNTLRSEHIFLIILINLKVSQLVYYQIFQLKYNVMNSISQ